MTVELEAATPVLSVEDYPRAKAFYMDMLGFEVHEEGGDPPRFGIFRNGRAQIFLNAWSGPDPRSHDGWRVYLHTADVDALAAQLSGRDVTIVAGPTSQSYGMREIEIDDPDGNRLCFGHDLDDA